MGLGPASRPFFVPCSIPSLRQRSEEHTSELQSRLHLVCRLLLEKKKINRYEQGTFNLPPHDLLYNKAVDLPKCFGTQKHLFDGMTENYRYNSICAYNCFQVLAD